MNDLKRVAAIHDISGYGKCSLTVVMPVMSAMGIEVCPVPTALLSTHTAGFTGYTFNDLTDDMEGFLNHWKTLDLNIDLSLIHIFRADFGNSCERPACLPAEIPLPAYDVSF